MTQPPTESVDKYEWTRGNMPFVYAVGDEVLELTDQKIVIALPLTWETLCVVDAIRDKVPNLTVIPCSSGENSSLQPGVFKYLEEWGVKHYKTASDEDRLAVLRDNPDIIVDCTFALGRVGIDHGALDGRTIILEDTKTGENVIEEHNLLNPYIILDNSRLKREYENAEGIGYSVIAALKGMGFYLPRYKVGVIGFGYVGHGLAKYAAASGAEVAVYDVDPDKQKEGGERYRALKKDELLDWADIIVTATGRKDVINRADVARLDKQLVLANAGGDDEWDRGKFFEGVTPAQIHEYITQSKIGSCTLREVCGGNSVNLAVGVSVSEFLDLTFAHLITALAQMKSVVLQPGKNDLGRFDTSFLDRQVQAVSWLQKNAG